jgi:hypothetical protein
VVPVAWHVEEIEDEFCVIKDDDGSSEGCHATRAEAMEQIAALYAAEPAAEGDASTQPGVAFSAFLVVEGIETEDGRYFELGALTSRQPPLPLMLQDTNPEWGGHTGAWYAGAIHSIERDDRNPSRWIARGNLLANADGARAEEMIRSGLRGVSVDASADDVFYDIRAVDADGWPIDVLARFQAGRILGGTVVPIPAFAETVIWFEDEDEPPIVMATEGTDLPRTEEPEVVNDGLPMLLLAGGGPASPPASWFENPALGAPTPLSIGDDGRISGHVATWETCHIGNPNTCVTAPVSPAKYAYFHTGEIVCADGTRLPVGQLTLGTGHAEMSDDARGAISHYDDTGAAVADIRVGEDGYGIWAAGSVRSGLTDEQIRQLRASSPSGDWRRISGYLELVAVLCVNVPGFPIPRTMARVASGVETALVAAPGVGAMAWPHRQNTREAQLAAVDRDLDSLRREVAILRASVRPLLGLARDGYMKTIRAVRRTG